MTNEALSMTNVAETHGNVFLVFVLFSVRKSSDSAMKMMTKFGEMVWVEIGDDKRAIDSCNSRSMKGCAAFVRVCARVSSNFHPRRRQTKSEWKYSNKTLEAWTFCCSRLRIFSVLLHFLARMKNSFASVHSCSHHYSIPTIRNMFPLHSSASCNVKARIARDTRIKYLIIFVPKHFTFPSATEVKSDGRRVWEKCNRNIILSFICTNHLMLNESWRIKRHKRDAEHSGKKRWFSMLLMFFRPYFASHRHFLFNSYYCRPNSVAQRRRQYVLLRKIIFHLCTFCRLQFSFYKTFRRSFFFLLHFTRFQWRFNK